MRSDVNSHLFEDAIPCLQYLRDCDIKTGIISNGNAILVPSSSSSSDSVSVPGVAGDDLGTASIVDTCTTVTVESLISIYLRAADLGAMKPSVIPFLAGAQLCGVPIARILYVGDHLENDVFGSKQAGMISAWLNRSSVDQEEEAEAKGGNCSSIPDHLNQQHIVLNSLKPEHFEKQVTAYFSTSTDL